MSKSNLQKTFEQKLILQKRINEYLNNCKYANRQPSLEAYERLEHQLVKTNARLAKLKKEQDQ